MVAKNGKNIECPICNKKFYVKKSALKKRKYCSRNCKATSMQKNRRPRKTKCGNCKKELDRAVRIGCKRAYCDSSCQLEYEYKSGKRDPKETTKEARRAHHEKAMKKYKRGEYTQRVSKRGYKMIYVPGEGYKREHHLVWRANNAGVRIPDGWHIHHINNDKLDNRIENLIALPAEMHHRLHAIERIDPETGRFKSAPFTELESF